MAAACGGVVVSMTPDEYMTDAALEYFDKELGAASDSFCNLRHAARCADVAHGAPFVAGMAEVRRLLTLADHLLDDPLAVMYDKYGYEGPLQLCAAWDVLDEAWRILTTLMRRTRSLRDLMAFGLAASRVAVLRARIAHRSRGTRHTAHGRSRTGPIAEVFRSLTQAAHAPPRVAAYPLPATAGGGPL